MFVLVVLDYLETQLEATTSHVTTTNVTLCYIQFNGITILTGFFFNFFQTHTTFMTCGVLLMIHLRSLAFP